MRGTAAKRIRFIMDDAGISKKMATKLYFDWLRQTIRPGPSPKHTRLKQQLASRP